MTNVRKNSAKLTREDLKIAPESPTMELSETPAVEPSDQTSKTVRHAPLVYRVEEIAQMLAISNRAAYNLCNTTKDFKVIRLGTSTVGDRQQLGDLLHPVDERGVSDGFAGLVRRLYGRVFVRSFVRNYHGISDRKFAWNCKFLTFHCRGFGRDFQVLTGQFGGIFADIRHRHVSFALLQTRCNSG